MTNTLLNRDLLAMVANDEYRCVKMFMEIEKNKWLSSLLYEEYYIINDFKQDYDAKKISILSPDFITNYKKHPFIEYFTLKKTDYLHCLLAYGDTDVNSSNVFNSVANDLHHDKEIGLIMAELEICRTLLHNSFPETKKKLVKRKAEGLAEREEV